MCIKSDFFFKLATNGQRMDNEFVPNGVVCPCPGAIYMYKTIKMCIKSEFEEIILKLSTNGQSDKGFLLTSTFVPKGLSAPALGLFTCIKAFQYIPGPGVRWAFTGALVTSPLVLRFFFKLYILDILRMSIYMLIKSLATRTWYSWVVGFRHPTQRSVLSIRTFVTKPQRLIKYVS